MKKIGAILLAAGAGKRFGGNKLETLILGEPMYIHAFRVLKKQHGICQIVVVTGNPRIAKTAQKQKMRVAWNAFPEKGISYSLRLGIEALIKEEIDMDAIMFMVSDQPWLRAGTVQSMLEAYDDGIMVLKYGERQGNPVVFSKNYFDELQKLSGDVGGRQIMEKNQEAIHYFQPQCERELEDIDRKDQIDQ